MKRSTSLAILPCAFAALAAGASAQTPFTLTGGGGAIPATGTGGTAGWPTGVPNTTRFDSPLTTPVPSDAYQFTSLEIYGLNHTWVGDVMIVIYAPSNVCFTILHRPGFIGTPLPGDPGNRSDLLAGTYVFVTDGAGQIPHSPQAAPESPISPGTYVQDFGNPSGGTWPSGTGSIFNVPLNQVPPEPGIWKLWIYDWASGDVGSCTGWALKGLRSPMPYCTSGTSLNGCEPHISAAANPSVSFAHACTIEVASVAGQRSGLIFYGLNNAGWSPMAWATGSASFLCVKPPTQRTTIQNSGGFVSTCTGALALDWNAFQSSNPSAYGQPWIVGENVYAQGWYRDPGVPKNTNLSDALLLVYEP